MGWRFWIVCEGLPRIDTETITSHFIQIFSLRFIETKLGSKDRIVTFITTANEADGTLQIALMFIGGLELALQAFQHFCIQNSPQIGGLNAQPSFLEFNNCGFNVSCLNGVTKYFDGEAVTNGGGGLIGAADFGRTIRFDVRFVCGLKYFKERFVASGFFESGQFLLSFQKFGICFFFDDRGWICENAAARFCRRLCAR